MGCPLSGINKKSHREIVSPGMGRLTNQLWESLFALIRKANYYTETQRLCSSSLIFYIAKTFQFSVLPGPLWTYCFLQIFLKRFLFPYCTAEEKKEVCAP